MTVVKSWKSQEALLYWQIASETRHALEAGAPEYEIEDLASEWEGRMLHTDSPRIRQGCANLLARCRPAENLTA